MPQYQLSTGCKINGLEKEEKMDGALWGKKATSLYGVGGVKVTAM